MSNIHKTAIVSSKAKIHPGASIGPYCVLDGEIEIGQNTKLLSHVCLQGKVVIGANNEIFPFAVIGGKPQDLKYNGEQSVVIIGSNNTIREHVTIHAGTAGGIMKTVIGDNCLIMVGSHIAHDCIVGNKVIMANNATLGGHVQVGDSAIIGGLAAVHQHVRIGNNAIVGGVSALVRDLIPYGSAVGDRASLVGLNLVGMKRHNISREDIKKATLAYEQIFDHNEIPLEQKIATAEALYHESTIVMEILDFAKYNIGRSLCVPDLKTKINSEKIKQDK